MSGVDVQDLAQVTIGSRTTRSGNAAASKAKQNGDKKQAGVTGLAGRLESGVAAKLDDNEAKAPNTIGKEVGRAIASARAAKEWTQKDLADKLAVQKAVILKLEQGTHTKDNKLLQKLESKLGVWLTGDASKLGTAEGKGKKGAAATKGTSSKLDTGVDEGAPVAASREGRYEDLKPHELEVPVVTEPEALAE